MKLLPRHRPIYPSPSRFLALVWEGSERIYGARGASSSRARRRRLPHPCACSKLRSSCVSPALVTALERVTSPLKNEG